ncbi:MAG: hypothetical protein ACR2F1_01640 [Nitrososphaeraceae archaeon]
MMFVPPLIFLVSIPTSLIDVDIAQYFWLASIPVNIIVGRNIAFVEHLYYFNCNTKDL